jgi:hypothetical protein
MERPEFPFEGDTANFLLHQDYCQYIDYYLDKVPTPGTPNPKYPDLYFLHDTPIQDLGGGVGQFTRTWGLLPGFNGDRIGTGSVYVRREAESFVWSRPGVNTTDSVFRIWFIDQNASIATLTDSQITLFTSVNAPITPTRWTHNVTATYATATIGYWVKDVISGDWKYFTYTTPVIARDATSITVAPVPFSDAGVSTPVLYVWFSKPQTKINPIPYAVSTFKYMDYWLPGLNCDSPEDIPLVQQWQILDENQNVTDTLSEATSPSLTEYKALITSKTLICMEASNIHRWQGNVWERTIRYGVPV